MQVQRAIKDRGGSTLERVRDVVKEWARVTAPLEIHVEKVSSFPAPDQIVILQMRKTTQLLDCAALNANTWHQLVASVNDSLLDVTFTAIEAEIAAFDSGREYSGGVIHFAATTAGGQRR
jgi:hypothetical protein